MCSIMGFTSKRRTLDEIRPFFDKTKSRGPDDSRVEETPSGYLCFHRLAIMGLTPEGMQPFHLDGDMCVCNGELYGFRPLKEKLQEKYAFQSDSDCELLLPLYREYGLAMFSMLDAEFAMVIYDSKKDAYIAARDPIGIRPLFYGYDQGDIVFASEAKNLVGLVEKVYPFPPGHYYADGQFIRFADLTTVKTYVSDDLPTIYTKIREKLTKAVEKRLDADAPLGFLLSGGLDSSLVCAIAAKALKKPIRTFAIGMDVDAIDLKYARQVAEYLGADHTEVYMTRQQVIDSLEEVIAMLGTYDITTIRASMGMYLCCKAIHERTDVRVLLTGEVSDELFGYKYTDFAPSPEASSRRPRSGWMSSTNTMSSGRIAASASTPWKPGCPSAIWTLCDTSCPSTRPKKVNVYGKGKYLLRMAFEGTTSPRASSGGRRQPSPTPWDTPWWTISRPTPKPSIPKRNLRKSGSSTSSPSPLPKRAFSTGRSLRNTIPARSKWSRTSGCPTRSGPAATSTTPPPAFSPTTAAAACKAPAAYSHPFAHHTLGGFSYEGI